MCEIFRIFAQKFRNTTMISLIISFYKRLDFLDLILQGVERQSYKDFEVIISEDDNADETVLFLDQARKQYSFPIKHVSQEDIGFRKTKILNVAVLVAEGDQLVFLDGDCIPHKHFLKQYNRTITKGVFCIGRRVMLSQKLSTKVKDSKNLSYLSFMNCLRYGVENYLKRAFYLPWIKENKGNKRGLIGCNMGGCKDDLLAVNGFDEDYQVPAVGEDCDLDWRLRAYGISIKTVFYRCLTYHLYHKTIHERNSVVQINNRAMMADKQKAGRYICANGIKKLQV